LINGEASQHHNTDGMSSEPAAHTFRSLGSTYAAGSERVLANDDPISPVGDIDASGVVLDIDPGKTLQPKI
jgi:hypothetical protein